MDWASWAAEVEKALPWNAVEGLGTALTAIFALLVYRETRRIRRSEWRSLIVEKWQSFNRFLVETNNAQRWEDVRLGRIAPADFTANDRILMLQFFNIQHVEFAASEHKLLHATIREAMAYDIAQMRAAAPYINTLLREAGHDQRFIRFVGKALEDRKA